MKKRLVYILCCLVGFYMNAQEEFHVFPKNHKQTPGTHLGNGSLAQPWDLQTALSQKSDIVTSGDTIWIHEGIYKGRFVSTLQSTEPNRYITVSAYRDDKVVLDGNVNSKASTVLEVKGQQIIFKNFEITWLGNYSRDANDANFQVCSGIRHLTGKNCRFYNLNIYNNPGLGIGSWKHSAGSIIENCMIYNNGFVAKNGKGRGEGIYVQNKSDEVRLIKNNIIFNNYYKAIEVWSAGKRADFEYVKNITLDGNIIFNSGNPSGQFYDNVIVASNDRNGINIAKNITLTNNVLYHNTSQPNGNLLGNAPSLTLGFNPNAPVENVVVDNNIIAGGYNGLRLLHSKSIRFTNNIIYTGIIQVSPSISKHFKSWDFSSNTIYSRLNKPFRIPKVKDHSLKSWTTEFNLDKDSQIIHTSEFDLPEILNISRHSQNDNTFNLALFDKDGKDVAVDFSEYKIESNSTYTIYDVENPEVVLKSGILNKGQNITFPMQNTDFSKPLHNTKAIKTLSSFGVFVIKFENAISSETSTKTTESALNRFLKWLGF